LSTFYTMDHDQYDHSFYDYAPTLAFDSFLNEEITGEAFGRFPSQSPPVERPTTKKKNKEKREPDNKISASGSTVLSESQKEQTEKEASNKKPEARVRKPSVDPSMPKRPVGRPRLYPAKPMDPNKPKRGKSILNCSKVPVRTTIYRQNHACFSSGRRRQARRTAPDQAVGPR
jgi:hypothetical protein